MDLLLNLPYITFNDLYIHVERIKSGWMDLCIEANGKSFNYGASYISDPLNDLLEAIVSIVEKDKLPHRSYYVNHVGDYVYVMHELEPGLVTWLFAYMDGALTLIIWEDLPPNFDVLIEADFNSQSYSIPLLEKAPDLTKELAFAMKGPLISFVKTIINTFRNLDNLEKFDDDSNGHDWGFTYSLDNFNILKEWLKKNEPSAN